MPEEKKTNKLDLSVACERVFGISVRRYRQLAQEGHVPKSENGIINFLIAARELFNYYRKSTATGTMSLMDEKTRLTKTDADKREIELRVLRGELVEMRSVEIVISRAITALKSKLLSVAPRCAPVVINFKNPIEAQEHIEGLIHEALNELSIMDYDEIKQDKIIMEDSEEISETATENVDKSVGG